MSRGVAGRYTDLIGPRTVALVGFLVVIVATIPFAFVTPHTDYVWLMAALLVRGLGMGVVIIPLTGASFIGLAHHEVPDASIITRVMQQVGGSMGTAYSRSSCSTLRRAATTRTRSRRVFGTLSGGPSPSPRQPFRSA